MEDSCPKAVALILYICTMLLGAAARYRHRSFGIWHHVLFAITGCSVGACLYWNFEISLIPVALALIALPFTRPRASRRHDLIALLGLLAFGFAFFKV